MTTRPADWPAVLAVCPVKGCPVRWRTGRNRRCPEHLADDERDDHVAEVWASGVMDAPAGRADPSPDGGGPAPARSLELAKPRR
jgi:hypothetical protein